MSVMYYTPVELIQNLVDAAMRFERIVSESPIGMDQEAEGILREAISDLLKSIKRLRCDNDRLRAALELGFRLVADRTGESGITPTMFLDRAMEALRPKDQ